MALASNFTPTPSVYSFGGDEDEKKDDAASGRHRHLSGKVQQLLADRTRFMGGKCASFQPPASGFLHAYLQQPLVPCILGLVIFFLNVMSTFLVTF